MPKMTYGQNMNYDLDKLEIYVHKHRCVCVSRPSTSVDKKDTRVVAVYVAVVQDEWDAFQFSHLRKQVQSDIKEQTDEDFKIRVRKLISQYLVSNFCDYLTLRIRTFCTDCLVER